MRRCARRPAGLFATIAFTLSLAGSAWASLCPAPADMADMNDIPVMASVHVPVDQVRIPAENRGRSGENGHSCPSAAAAQGCATAAILPAGSIADLTPSPEGVIAADSSDTERDLLFSSALFRPPRA